MTDLFTLLGKEGAPSSTRTTVYNLWGGDRQMNILEYLKTEILDEKRIESRVPVTNSSPDKENGTVVSFFEIDIALKI